MKIRQLQQLRQRCIGSESVFEALGKTTITNQGPYTFIDRGADVLAVAHLDSVSYDHAFTTVTLPDGDIVVWNRQLDDRLGVWIILDILPALGVKCDVLLTTGEEMGLSTADKFEAPDGKEWNWMFQFDRAGTDVVCYQYEDDNLTELLEDAGCNVHDGLFSDISDLEHLGIKGMNFGCAYYDNHEQGSHAVMSETDLMIRLFMSFYHKNKDTKLEHTESPYGHRYTYGYGAYSYPYDEHDSWEAKIDVSHRTLNYAQYEENYKKLIAGGMDMIEASTQAWEDVQEADATFTCPGCGYEYTEGQMPELWDVGMCKWCRESYLRMETTLQPIHRLTTQQWSEYDD